MRVWTLNYVGGWRRLAQTVSSPVRLNRLPLPWNEWVPKVQDEWNALGVKGDTFHVERGERSTIGWEYTRARSGPMDLFVRILVGTEMRHSDRLSTPPTTFRTIVFFVIFISALVRIVFYFIEVIRQGDLTSDAVLIGITDMFVFQTYYKVV